eukprot:COSAG02_NODE_39603_length_415_cov_0.813291_1_plen_62_part_01
MGSHVAKLSRLWSIFRPSVSHDHHNGRWVTSFRTVVLESRTMIRGCARLALPDGMNAKRRCL